MNEDEAVAGRPADDPGAEPEAWSSPVYVGPTAGRAPHLEVLTRALTSSRHFLLSAVRDADAAMLAAKPPYGGNTIGQLLVHLAAAERLFQNLTGRGTGFGEDEGDTDRAFRFAEDPLAGRGLDAYLAHLAEVRGATLALFAARDDGWLAEPRTFAGHPSTTHYYWLHLLMDEARHTGQIILLRKYLLGMADAAFDPYGGL
jgi:uncharacterized damage-inducible protein DinB